MSKEKPKPRDDSGSFYEFQELCKELGDETKHSEKTKIMKTFLENFEGDVYLLYKLILTKSDQRKYSLKDKKLIKIFDEILGGGQEEMMADLEKGDVSETLRKFFKENESCQKWSSWTLKEVDDFLDHLTTISKQKEQVRAFERFCVNKATPNDIKFLIRLIIGDLKTSAGAKFLLAALHPDAFNVFTVSNDLKGVVQRSIKTAGGELSTPITPNHPSFNDDDFEKVLSKPDRPQFDPNDKMDEEEGDNSDSGSDSEGKKKKKKKGKKGDDSDSDSVKKKKTKTKMKAYINLMTPVKPMLAKASKTYDDSIKRCPNGFFIETKYDGERIQIHKDGKNFKFYSRNLKPVVENKVADVKKYILQAIEEDKIILDGEILLVDLKTGLPLPFGTLGKHKKAQFKDAVVAIFIFDILYYDGKGMLGVPLEKRRKVLEKVVRVIPNRIMLSEYDLAIGSAEDKEVLLSAKMTNAIELGLEGLVLKDIQGDYEPAARHWIKIKKDYLKGMADSADLLVLGAYYGTGSKGGKLSVFLMGCWCNTRKKYVPVCKAGNGHDDATIDELQNRLIPKMVKISQDRNKLPDWFDGDHTLTPDWMIKDPKDTEVWEISGAEFSKSSKFTLGISIRFPRVTRIRDDKGPEDATTAQEIKDLYEESKRTSNNTLLKDIVKQKSHDELEREHKRERSEEDDDLPAPKKKKDEKSERQEDKNKEPIKKDLPKKEAPIKTQGQIQYHFGVINEPILPESNKILVHSVDNSGNWSTRGSMGQISSKWKQPESNYKLCHASKKNNVVGSLQIVDIDPGKLFVGTMIGQRAQGKGAPPIQYDAFEKALKELAKVAQEKKCQVHFSKFHSSVPDLDWNRCEKLIDEHLVSKGIQVIVYTKDPQDKQKCESKPVTKVDIMEEEDVLGLKLLDDDIDDELPESKTYPEGMFEEDDEAELLKGCNCVLAGYSQPETQELSALIKSLGGVVQPKWSLKGSDKSTHLICDTFNNVFDHVDQLGGVIVCRKWVDEIKSTKWKQKEAKFKFPAPKSVDVKPITEIKPKETTPTQPKSSFPEVKTDMTVKTKTIVEDLANIFSNCVILLNNVKDTKLKRHIIAYDGVVAEKFDSTVTHVVTDTKGNFSCPQVKPSWINACCEKKKLVSIESYKL